MRLAEAVCPSPRVVDFVGDLRLVESRGARNQPKSGMDRMTELLFQLGPSRIIPSLASLRIPARCGLKWRSASVGRGRSGIGSIVGLGLEEAPSARSVLRTVS